MIDEALIELLRPLIREVVREELERRDEQRWLRVPEASRKLGLTRKAVYHRVSRGQLGAQRIGRTLYVDTQLDPLP
jgi:hypothetical protein